MQETFQGEVISRRQAEFDKIRTEREERISQMIRARKQERDIKRKQLYYLTTEEERIRKLQEEEEAHKREGEICFPLNSHHFTSMLELYLILPFLFQLLCRSRETQEARS